MTNDARKWMFNSYIEQLNHHFRHHPRQEELVSAMGNGQLTVAEIDEAFKEAEAYTTKWMFNRNQVLMNELGNGTDTVQFKVHHE